MTSVLYVLTAFFAGIVLAWILHRLFAEKGVSKDSYNLLDKEYALLEDRLKSMKEQKEYAEQQLEESREQIKRYAADLKEWQVSYRYLQEKLERQQKEIEGLHERSREQFKTMARDIFKENSREFAETHHKNVKSLLEPLKEKIATFEKKVEETYNKESGERNVLKNEIKNLAELNQKISEEANNLTRALKADTKAQGNWGEMILEKILEKSGLTRGREYTIQGMEEPLKDDEGNRYQPDVVVHLPEKKHVVIDAKVSLVAYDRFVNAEGEEERNRSLKEHLASVRKHVDELSKKNYQDLYGINSPDFVLLFMPLEAAFGAAIQNDQALFSYAWEHQIVIVSPSTLLATLRTIASIWRREDYNRNAQEIARQGGKLYDKMVSFVEDLDKVGNSLDQTKKVYDEAYKKLYSGKGNLVSRAEKISKLGGKTGKKLSPTLREEAEDDEASEGEQEA